MDKIGVVIAILFFGSVIVILLRRYLLSNKIKKEGIEVDGIITKVSESEGTDSDGISDGTYTYANYVSYKDNVGNTQKDALIINYSSRLTEETKVIIKYHPSNPKRVLIIHY